MKCYVVGDIHGCSDELKCMVESLPLAQGDRIVFLGDYIDRGADSRGVVTYLAALQNEVSYDIVFLKGNHEDMFLSYLGLEGRYGDMFLFNGGEATLASYGLSSRKDPQAKIAAAIPDTHIDFFRELKSYHTTGDFLCVHAGIHPAKPLALQLEEDLFWIRDTFIMQPHALPYTVLFGHTPHREVLCDLPYKVGLDTGLVYGNKLSCLELTERMLFQIPRGGRKISSTSLRGSWERVQRTFPA